MDDETTAPSIKASCPECGDVILATGDLSVVVQAGSNQTAYVFRCPGCHLATAQPAAVRVVELLVVSGVRLRIVGVPEEAGEPHEGAPLEADDLLDFHLELQGEGWFERLRAMTDRKGSRQGS